MPFIDYDGDFLSPGNKQMTFEIYISTFRL